MERAVSAEAEAVVCDTTLNACWRRERRSANDPDETSDEEGLPEAVDDNEDDEDTAQLEVDWVIDGGEVTES
jgi:hypothetical protein